MNIRKSIRFLLLYFVMLTEGNLFGQVSFSMPGGFYPHVFTLELAAAEGLQVHYTTDGSVPTPASPLYQHPLTLDSSLYSTLDIFLMRDAPEAEWNPPATVRHAIVLRAAAFDDLGQRHGSVSTHTYLIADLLEHTHQLPAVSIALDHNALFNPDTGIFSPNGWDSADNYNTGNFNQHGQEWERVANVEFYELDNQGFSQQTGLRVHGGNNRIIMQKSLKLYARKEYGEKNIAFPLFDEVPYSRFKRLVLRPFCAGWTAAGIQDLLAQKIARPLRFVPMASRPVSLYINGEYWGVYYLQESPDERLVAQIDDVDADDVDIIGSWLGNVEHGSNVRFQSLMDWLGTADLSDSLQYEYLCTLIDIDDFIDYQLMEAFTVNVDWPANNMRMYQHGRSPWRWLLFDGDACFGSTDVPMDELLTYDGDDLWPSSRESTLCFRRLLASPIFLARFRERLNEVLEEVFDYSRTGTLLAEIHSAIESEVEWQSARFGVPADKGEWHSRMDDIDWFLRHRPDIFRKQMEMFLYPPANTSPEVFLFPNPARDYVNIQGCSSGTEWVQCHLYDCTGRLVATHSLLFISKPSVTHISLASLVPGVYLLSIPAFGTLRRVVVL